MLRGNYIWNIISLRWHIQVKMFRRKLEMELETVKVVMEMEVLVLLLLE